MRGSASTFWDMPAIRASTRRKPVMPINTLSEKEQRSFAISGNLPTNQ
jgi:hypothetical protein